MIENTWNRENCNILITNHDFHHHKLINSFMHRNLAGEAA